MAISCGALVLPSSLPPLYLRPPSVSGRPALGPLLAAPRYSCSHAATLRVRASVGGGGEPPGGGFDLGDFGARDAFPAELESSFGEKVLGNADTQHRILIPSTITQVAGLASRTCSPVPAGTAPLSEAQARELLKRVVGWKLVHEPGPGVRAGAQEGVGLRLRGEWKVKDLASALELLRRVGQVAEEQGHHPDLHVQPWNHVRVDAYTHSLDGLTENDFILAAKIDIIPVADLIRRTRFWA